MKKTVLVVVLCLVTVLAVVIVGCGSSGESEQASDFETLEKEAEELLSEADTAWEALAEKLDEYNRTTEAVVMAALAGDTSNLTPDQTTGLVSQAEALTQEAQQVKAKYEAMIKPEYEEYKGIDAYAAYAQAMVDALDAYELVLSSAAGFLARVEPLLASGDTAGLQALIQESAEDITRLQEEQKAAEQALDDAQDIKSTQHLGK